MKHDTINIIYVIVAIVGIVVGIVFLFPIKPDPRDVSEMRLHGKLLESQAEVARLRSKHEPPAPAPSVVEQQPADCQEW